MQFKFLRCLPKLSQALGLGCEFSLFMYLIIFLVGFFKCVGTLFLGSFQEANSCRGPAASVFPGRIFCANGFWEHELFSVNSWLIIIRVLFCPFIFSKRCLLKFPSLWQSCYYVPPVLRPRPAAVRTPPSGMEIQKSVCLLSVALKDTSTLIIITFFSSFTARTRGVEQQGGKKYSGSLSNPSKFTNNFPSPKHASADTGNYFIDLLVFV